MFGRPKASPQTPTNKSGKTSRRATSTATQNLLVDNIPVVFTQKRVKNINLRVKSPDGHVEASAPLWVDATVVEAFVRSKKDWIRKQQQSLGESPRVDIKKLTRTEREEGREQIALRAQPLFEKWEPIMGVQPTCFAYRYMTSRWGSCNPSTGRICLNIQLLNYPPECLEYVVVHELCHLLERGHGPRFKALMDHYLPDWRERRALLR